MKEATAVVEKMREILREKRKFEAEIRRLVTSWYEENGWEKLKNNTPPMWREYATVNIECNRIAEAIETIEKLFKG